ncbi:MAG: hypothetical protein WDN69_29330 [Aliidongia sp.]
MQSEQIVLGPERVLRNAKLTGTIADRGLAEGRLSAGIGGGKLDFRLDRVEAGGQFGLNTDDFGALLKVGGVSDDVVGRQDRGDRPLRARRQLPALHRPCRRQRLPLQPARPSWSACYRSPPSPRSRIC